MHTARRTVRAFTTPPKAGACRQVPAGQALQVGAVHLQRTRGGCPAVVVGLQGLLHQLAPVPGDGLAQACRWQHRNFGVKMPVTRSVPLWSAIEMGVHAKSPATAPGGVAGAGRAARSAPRLERCLRAHCLADPGADAVAHARPPRAWGKHYPLQVVAPARATDLMQDAPLRAEYPTPVAHRRAALAVHTVPFMAVLRQGQLVGLITRTDAIRISLH